MIGINICSFRTQLRLNMELDRQSLFGLPVHSCTHWLIPRNHPSYMVHIRGRFWSAKIHDISCDPLGCNIASRLSPHTVCITNHVMFKFKFSQMYCERTMIGINICGFRTQLRLNMELDRQSLFGLPVHSCTHWLIPRNHP